MSNALTPQAVRAIEENFDNIVEAFELIALIDFEFRSDPRSVQCFDLRIVERVKWCAARRKTFWKEWPELL